MNDVCMNWWLIDHKPLQIFDVCDWGFCKRSSVEEIAYGLCRPHFFWVPSSLFSVVKGYLNSSLSPLLSDFTKNMFKGFTSIFEVIIHINYQSFYKKYLSQKTPWVWFRFLLGILNQRLIYLYFLRTNAQIPKTMRILKCQCQKIQVVIIILLSNPPTFMQQNSMWCTSCVVPGKFPEDTAF